MPTNIINIAENSRTKNITSSPRLNASIVKITPITYVIADNEKAKLNNFFVLKYITIIIMLITITKGINASSIYKSRSFRYIPSRKNIIVKHNKIIDLNKSERLNM